MTLRVAEGDCGSRPSVKPDYGLVGLLKHGFVHGHLPGRSPCLKVIPKLKSGDHSLMAYHPARRNPLLLLVGDGIECLG